MTHKLINYNQLSLGRVSYVAINTIINKMCSVIINYQASESGTQLRMVLSKRNVIVFLTDNFTPSNLRDPQNLFLHFNTHTLVTQACM